MMFGSTQSYPVSWLLYWNTRCVDDIYRKAYKQEAIQSMVMATYTKIFFKFDRKFWFDTEVRRFVLIY